MRSNLLSLQGTVDLLDRTQSRLSSGKKVNTAMDNPVSFFAAQSLTSRASVIDSLKDAMGQAVQTITAADKGITSISALIEQAKGLAQQALSTEMELDVAAVPGVTTVTVGTIAATETFSLGGVTLTAITTGTPTAAQFLNTAAGLAAAINANTTIAAAGYSATEAGGTITITSTAAAIAVGGTADATATEVTAYAAATTEANPEFTSLQAQYNEMRSQIDDLADDSGYKGKNLLNAGVTLTVKFEGTHKLDVAGFDASTGAAGLNITTADNWATAAAIDASVVELDSASDTLRAKSSALSGNLSIISVRQNFSTNMINTLTAGADKLTMADTNEEGANMLMLQTRQSLSTTALSLSAQAAQSVLKLFA
jgi:flagellin-like hook-associated protein FlgL